MPQLWLCWSQGGHSVGRRRVKEAAETGRGSELLAQTESSWWRAASGWSPRSALSTTVPSQATQQHKEAQNGGAVRRDLDLEGDPFDWTSNLLGPRQRQRPVRGKGHGQSRHRRAKGTSSCLPPATCALLIPVVQHCGGQECVCALADWRADCGV